MDTPQALFEVLPTCEVQERTLEQYYHNEQQRHMLEMNGFVPVNPLATQGIALKVIREMMHLG